MEEYKMVCPGRASVLPLKWLRRLRGRMEILINSIFHHCQYSIDSLKLLVLGDCERLITPAL